MAENVLAGALLRAIDELSHKIYIPATTLALYADYLPMIKDETGFENPWWLYVACFFFAGLLSFWFVFIFAYIEDWLEGKLFSSQINLQKLVGTLLLPLGVIGISPEYLGLNEPIIGATTGIACSIWGFLLLSGRRPWPAS